MILIVLFLSAAVSCSLLFVVHQRNKTKEEILRKKQKNWMKTWKKVVPYVKKFPADPIFGLIRSLIVFAVEKYIDSSMDAE